VQIINRGKLVFTDTTAGLEQRMHATAIIAAFHAAPDIEALQQLPDVNRAEPLPDNRVRIHYSGSNPAEALVEQSVAQHWRLHELTPETRTLEQIFIELTCSEEHAADSEDASQ
jgi:ABC-2 type transport system ATP-binding protein